MGFLYSFVLNFVSIPSSSRFDHLDAATPTYTSPDGKNRSTRAPWALAWVQFYRRRLQKAAEKCEK